ncbi:MAG: D-glycero-beta-D-manno-heptose 1-phosphate adenylyltransferase [Kiloniellales bacterium]
MTDGADLAARLEALAQARVLIVGDVMLDRFVYGAVDRVSPEGPVPVLRVEREAVMLGGAGNVLRNLSALGVAGALVAVIGEDAAGARLAELAGDLPGAEDGLIQAPNRPTTIKERYIAAGQQLLRADRETRGALAPDVAGQVLEAVCARLLDGEKPVGALVLSDYGKGVLDDVTIRALIAAAGEAGCPVVVDPKGRDYGLYRGASLVTPNRRELAEATGLPTGEDDEVVAAARALIEDAGVAAVLATRSERGMTLVATRADRSTVDTWHIPASGREVYDVSGAGDTVAAVLAAGLAAGIGLEDSARLANAAAGIVVGKLGTAVVGRDELRRSLLASDLMAAEAKVVDFETVVAQAARWREAGLVVGFTNGCFDLLHPGHISLFEQARGACDYLIVGLNSDASVQRLKGAGRPVQAEAARAAVLASLASVDLVVVFSEETPIKLIEALKPDVLIKGADYREDQVVGADIVKAHGGRVLLAELTPGHSTSETIRKLSG